MAATDRETPPLLGRVPELERLRAGLRAALAGRGELLLVTGEPGIGKTRLVEAAAAEAVHEGTTVVWGRCWEAGGAPAYWPWIEALRGLVAERGAEALRDGAPRAAAEAARLVPELVPDESAEPGPSGEAAQAKPSGGAAQAKPSGAAPARTPPGGPAEPEPSGEAARFALFDGVAQLLIAGASARPLVLVLEDLHAADPASLLLLDLLAPRLRSARLLALATYRLGDPATDPAVERLLAGLSRRGEQLALSGLDLDSTRALAAASAGTELPERTLAGLLERTEGNPFFVQSLARVLGDAPDQLAPATLPAGVRETLARRVEPLPPASRAALAAAAGLGRDFSVARVARLRGISPAEALALIDPAVRAALVVPGETAGELRFAHALIRDWLYAELGPSERAELHRREAEALEAEAARDPDLLHELARHRVAAASAGDAAGAVDACERAARHALTRLAFEDAAELFARGLALAERLLEPLEPARRARLMLDLGDAQRRAGDAAAAREAFARAANMARANAMPDELAEAALGFGGVVVHPGETDETLVALLEQALARLPEERPVLRSRLLARLARELHFSPDVTRPRALATEAVAIAERARDPASHAFALGAWHVAMAAPDTVDERLEAAAAQAELARQAGDIELELWGRILHAIDQLELGRPDAADAELDECDVLAARLRQPAQTWRVLLVRGTLALLAGRFDEAEQVIAQAYDSGRRSRGRAAYRYRLLQEGELRYLRGGYAELEEEIRALALEAPAVWGIAVPHMLAMTGRLDEARAGFEVLAAAGFAGPVDDMVALPRLSRCAEMCHALGDAARAAVLYERLLPHADRWLVFAGGICTGTVRLRLGMLAATMGRLDEAAEHLERAVRAHRDAGAAPITALAEFELAEVLRELGREEGAAELTGHALRTARALGMAPLIERIEGAAAGRPAPAPAGRARLELEGEYWVAEFAGTEVRLRDRKGIAHLARLVEDPHRELSALELAGAGGASPGDAGELLDADAKRAYRRRVDELRAEVDEAERWNDPERAERASAELAFVTSELSRAVGLGGRDRRAASDAERARVSVTRAIRSAIAAVEEQHPELGRHLEAAVRTGAYCRYAPDAGEEIAWSVRRGPPPAPSSYLR